MHFSRQIHNSGWKLKNQTNDLIFSFTFSSVFVTFIFVFENSQNLYSCGPPFYPFWSVKFRNFQQKLPISTTIILLQKVNTMSLLKTHVLSPEESQKMVSTHELYVIIQSNPRNITFKVNRQFLCIAHMWSLFCSVQVYISLYFAPLQICNFPLSLFYKSPFLS